MALAILLGTLLVAGLAVAVAIGTVELLASDGLDDEPEPEVPPGQDDNPFAAPAGGSVLPTPGPFATDLHRHFVLDGVLQEGHRVFTLAPALCFVGGWIMSVLDSNGNGGGSGGDSQQSALVFPDGSPALAMGHVGGMGGVEASMVFGILIGALVCVGIAILIRSWFEVGWIRVQRDLLVDGDSDFGQLFGGADRTLDMLGWRIIRAMLIYGPFIAALVPLALTVTDPDFNPVMVFPGLMLVGLSMLYIAPGLFLGGHFVVLDGAGPIDALVRSWEAARGNRVTLVIYAVVLGVGTALIQFAGVFLLCVGLIATVPYGRTILDAAWTGGWLRARFGPEMRPAPSE